MTRIAAILAAASLTLAPASVLACAMEFEIPEEVEQPSENDPSHLAALMGEIDSLLTETEPAEADADAAKIDAAAKADATKTDATAQATKADEVTTPKKADKDS